MATQKMYSITDFDLKNKRVFVRTDFNVPVQKGQVQESISACNLPSPPCATLCKKARGLL